MARGWRRRAAQAVLALGWTASALLTLVLLLLLAQPFFIGECSSYERAGQHAARVGAGLTAVLLAAAWIGGVLGLRTKAGAGVVGHVVLAVSLPIALVAAFVLGATLTDWLIERVAPGGDHAMCW